MRKKVLDFAIGLIHDQNSHKKVVDWFNEAKGSKFISMSSPWNAATISAVFYKCGCSSIFPTAHDCEGIIQYASTWGIWHPKNSCTEPKFGDVIVYEDNGYRIGIISKVNNTEIQLIEGDFGIDSVVSTRLVAAHGPHIVGIITPAYESMYEFSQTPKKKKNK